jgi:drug/metabolite transporter (DMT)-like permease
MRDILIILACVPLYICNAMCDKLVSATIENKYSAVYNCIKFALCSICAIPFLFIGDTPVLGIGSLLCGLTCGLMYAISKNVMLKGYAVTSVAFMTLCHSAGMIVPCVLGHFLWEEALRIFTLLGILLTVGAIGLLKDVSGSKTEINTKGLLYGFITFLTSAGVMISQKCMGMYFADESVGFYNLFSFAVAMLMLCPLLKVTHIRNDNGKTKRTVCVCAFGSAVSLSVISFVMTSLASNVPSVILFPVFNGTGILLVCIVSAVLFQERLTMRKIIGLIVGILGLFMINI